VSQVRAVLPRREDLSADRGVLIVSYASHKRKAYAFFLLQVGRGWGGMCVGLLPAAAGGRLWRHAGYSNITCNRGSSVIRGQQ
jgi:hypothetical protein